MTTPPAPPAPAARSTRWKVIWLLIAFSAVVAGSLATYAYRKWQDRGVTVTVRFQDAHGLRPGAQLRYRGMIVGEVTDVALRADRSGIDMRVRLPPETAFLASTGSQFWIVRPTANFATGLGGLDTLVGDQYLAVLPEPAPGPVRPETEFEGSEEAAPPAYPKGCLKLILTAREKTPSIRPNAPIYAAGMPVGLVRSVKLVKNDQDATLFVRAEAYIEKEWASVVRKNSTFWKLNAFDTGGRFMLRIIISGLGGGLEIVTVGPPGDPVEEDKVHEFEIPESKAETEAREDLLKEIKNAQKNKGKK